MVLIVPGKGNADVFASVGFFTYMVLVKVLGAHSGGGLVPPGTWIWCHSGNGGGLCNIWGCSEWECVLFWPEPCWSLS